MTAVGKKRKEGRTRNEALEGRMEYKEHDEHRYK